MLRLEVCGKEIVVLRDEKFKFDLVFNVMDPEYGSKVIIPFEEYKDEFLLIGSVQCKIENYKLILRDNSAPFGIENNVEESNVYITIDEKHNIIISLEQPFYTDNLFIQATTKNELDR